MSEQVQYSNGEWSRETTGPDFVPRGPEIPFFEGKPVTTTKLKITSTAGLDIDNTVLKADDIIRIVVEARVSQVHHNVNEKTGEMERVHTAKAISVEIAPWNPADPTDTGIFRG